jgi:DNA-binding transcriptional ArsR family regulator
MQPEKLQIDRIFHALGDPTRRAMVEKLGEGPVSVSRLAEPFGMTLAAVVQHVQVLEECGLVRTEKPGRVRTCRVEPSGLDLVAQWLADRRSLWERRLDRLAEVLAETGEEELEGSEPEWLG